MSGTKFLLIQRWCYWTTEIELDILKFWVELHIYLKPILSFPHRFPSFPSFSKNSQGQTSTNVELLTIKKETYKLIIKKEQVCNITQTRTNCPYATNCYMANNHAFAAQNQLTIKKASRQHFEIWKENNKKLSSIISFDLKTYIFMWIVFCKIYTPAPEWVKDKQDHRGASLL